MSLKKIHIVTYLKLLINIRGRADRISIQEGVNITVQTAFTETIHKQQNALVRRSSFIY